MMATVAATIQNELSNHQKRKGDRGLIERCECGAAPLVHLKHQAEAVAKRLADEGVICGHQ